MTIEQVKREYRHHHRASRRGYLSRKCEGTVEPYKGRFGKGYIIVTPRWDSTQYVNIDYYVK